MHIAIIGAGASGLCAIRNAQIQGFKCTAFEQNGEIGGIWIYTDQTGLNKYGIPIHTSMYKNLRTNLPKEIMNFPDFPFSEPALSYVSQEEVLKYLHDYSKRFGLEKHIEFFQKVLQVEPIANNRWRVTIQDIRSKIVKQLEFDAIVVSNGHFSTPNIPNYENIEVFQGKVIHSHDYRKAEDFKGLKCVVVGAGPSGIELVVHLSKETSQTFLSHHSTSTMLKGLPKEILQKPDIKKFKSKSIIFDDGSEEEIDCILFCTGYKNDFPFLSEKCKITVDDNYIFPLYKQIINIEYPTMGFIGFIVNIATYPAFDLQIRFFYEYLKNPSKFPSKQLMFQDLELDRVERKNRGLNNRRMHFMENIQRLYFGQLATMANIEPIEPVIFDIYDDRKAQAFSNLVSYRGDNYTIIDKTRFTVQRGNAD